jgi:hypothetical protein
MAQVTDKELHFFAGVVVSLAAFMGAIDYGGGGFVS